MEAAALTIEGKEDHPGLVADVAVDGAFHGSGRGILSYSVPGTLSGKVTVGQLVWVPIRRQVSLGLIVALEDRCSPVGLKPLRSPVEPAFALDGRQLDTVFWLARETASSVFSAASPFFPPGVTHRAVEFLRLSDRGRIEPLDGLTPAQCRLIEYLGQREEASLDAARSALKSKLTTIVPRLEQLGLVERVVRVVDAPPANRRERFVRLTSGADAGRTAALRSAKQRAVVDFLAHRARLSATGAHSSVPLGDVVARTGTDRASIAALVRKGLIEEHSFSRIPADGRVASAPAPELTTAQAAAWRLIEHALQAGDPTPLLLHGVTGSGKTELYLRAVAWCLRRGRSAIVLVPEIPLATQVVRRFQARFPGDVAVVHSALPDRERYAAWREIAAGERRVVVGPRSALFAPVTDLGVIVLDEEHESAFKQESEPRYHARSLAEHLAARDGSAIILGSATPSVETAWRARERLVRRIGLPERVGLRQPGTGETGNLELPPVEVVDMRLELHRGRSSILSAPLAALIESTLGAREQAILFLNRRGMATVVICRSCGHAWTCPNCDVPMVYHQDRGRLLCHRCNHREIPRQTCDRCSGTLTYLGAGTQRVEDEIKAAFPGARVVRWDQDSVRRRGGNERLLQSIERREVDIVVGTQMIAKGLDLPMVTAVGVIHADTMLHLPDFRSAERTFQVLTQVAGRAGRRAGGSRVIVQTYSPNHYAIRAASRHDYEAFYADEIDFRRVHRYPPFSRLVRFLYRHQDEARCAAEAEEQARLLARHARRRAVDADLIGPTPAFVGRVRGKYQWHVILRAAPEEFDRLLDDLPARAGWSIDVDPQSVL